MIHPIFQIPAQGGVPPGTYDAAGAAATAQANAIAACAPKDQQDYMAIPIEWAIDGAAAPDATGALSSTNTIMVRKFAGTVGNQDVFIPVLLPPDKKAASGVIQYRVHFFITESTAPSNEGVAFSLKGAALTTGDLLSSALGTAVVVALAARSDPQYSFLSTAWSTDVTITGLNSDKPMMILNFSRVQDNAADTYGQKVGVAFIEIRFVQEPAA